MKNMILSAAAALSVAASAAFIHDSNSSSAMANSDLPSGAGITSPDLNDDAIFEARPAAEGRRPSFRVFELCRRHIESNFERLTSVKQIALECHSNVNVMRNAFRFYAHEDPYNFLMNLKKNHMSEMSRHHREVAMGGQYTLWGYSALASR